MELKYCVGVETRRKCGLSLHKHCHSSCIEVLCRLIHMLVLSNSFACRENRLNNNQHAHGHVVASSKKIYVMLNMTWEIQIILHTFVLFVHSFWHEKYISSKRVVQRLKEFPENRVFCAPMQKGSNRWCSGQVFTLYLKSTRRFGWVVVRWDKTESNSSTLQTSKENLGRKSLSIPITLQRKWIYLSKIDSYRQRR